jgi:hypothetical protein
MAEVCTDRDNTRPLEPQGFRGRESELCSSVGVMYMAEDHSEFEVESQLPAVKSRQDLLRAA